uniref:Bm13529 n=1 Tax=Brugia malayi TaxID=6279 RepID=A0A1I9G465_BRUMA|nr:Bm13529 [Brugia malayi]
MHRLCVIRIDITGINCLRRKEFIVKRKLVIKIMNLNQGS